MARTVKAYWLLEAVKGEMTYLIYATSAAEARQKFLDGDRGEAVEYQTHPAGIREIRRAPEEDTDAA